MDKQMAAKASKDTDKAGIPRKTANQQQNGSTSDNT
jgi:hypothetical protein